MSKKNFLGLSTLILSGTLILTSCQSADVPSEEVTEENSEVTIIVHDSFPNEEFEEMASAATGLDVKVITSGGGEELTTTLALTKGEPLADAFYGIDNFFASRLVEHEAVEPFIPSNLPDRAQNYLYDEKGSMLPVTIGATCLNIDDEWFASNDLGKPVEYADLLKSEYEGLTVLIDPVSSTTGSSFYLGTIAEFGLDEALNYWEDLVANGARIEQGWSDAYYSHFTAGSPDGTYPIVVSYSSSPAYTVNDEGTESATSALLETCSSTVEYAGILAGAKNSDGAKKLIEFLYSKEFQDSIADTMYVYPVDENAYTPKEWEEFAPFPQNPRDVQASEIGENREAWLEDISSKLGF